ncbi:MAG: two-component regulator propeller domain-containing protein [Silvibacterium sp.]
MTTKEVRHYALTTWRTDQGLPQNFITAIEQTPDGFLWIGTLGGLARFDGLHFTTFPGGDDHFSLQDRTTGLATDRDGSVWIASSSGLSHYANGKFTQVPNQAGAQRYAAGDLLADLDGGVWVVTHDGLFHVDGDKFLATPISAGGRVQAANSIAESTDRTLWVATSKDVVALRGGKIVHRYTKQDGLFALGTSILYADSFGNLYAGDGHHLVRFNGTRFEPVPSPGLGNFVSLLTDHRGNLWMASGGLHGISRKVGSKADLLTAKDGLASNDARILFEDNTHDIWIGTIAGLQRLHDGVFTTYTEDDGLPRGENQYDAVFEGKQNDIWVGSLEDGVARGRNGGFQRFSVKEGLKRGQVRGFVDMDGGIAVALSDYGLFQLRGKRFVKVPGLPHGYITSPAIDEAGVLWFAVGGDGVYSLRNGVFNHYTTHEGLPSNTVWSILPDRGGMLAGTNNGLARMRNDRFERIAEGAVITIRKDNEAFWLGTTSGLVYAKDGHAIRITQEQGLPSNQVHSIEVDAGGNLWIATATAIARLDRGELNRVLAGEEKRLWPKIFTQADGLRSRDVLPSGQVSTCRAHDGRIWFATAGGLSVVDPQLEPAPLAQAFIESIAVDDVPQSDVDGIVVPPGRHRLTFTYTAPDLHSPEQLRFRYRLEGWDKSWREAGAARQVSYTALPPGKYRLEILAANEDGVWSTHSASVDLRIKPFFYQTKLFLSFASLVLITLVIEITRRRTKRTAERQKLRFQERAAERERIAYQIHDTIIQDMVGTALQLELIGMQIPEQPQNARNLLQGLTARMREMVSKSRNMVSSLHSTATPEYDLLEVLRNAAEEFRLGEAPELTLSAEGSPREIDPLVRDEVYRICREALANAFRHSNASIIEVCVIFREDAIEVAIEDNGDGMDEETRIHGRAGHFGLGGMQAHASRIDATVMIQSDRGAGTRVHLTVPAIHGNWWHALRNRIDTKRDGAIQ